MNIDWSSPIVGYGAVIVLIGLIAVMFVGLYKAGNARTLSRPASERHLLILPRVYLVALSPALIMFLAFPVVGFLSGNKSMTIGVALTFLALALLPLYVFVEYFRGRHRITDGGLEYGRVFGSRGKMSWISVKSIRYVQWSKWFRLESTTGEVARVSSFVRDISEFARVALASVPASAIDEQTTQILQETASGSPPPMSGHWVKKPD